MAYDSEVMGDIGRGGSVATDLAGRVRSETLVLVGGASLEWMIDVARQVADALPKGRYRVQEGHEHVLPPELLNADRTQSRSTPYLDPAALLLITMSAANALTVYPHITRGIFQTTNSHDPDLVHHYANQLAQVLTKLRPHARPTESPQA